MGWEIYMSYIITYLILAMTLLIKQYFIHLHMLQMKHAKGFAHITLFNVNYQWGW